MEGTIVGLLGKFGSLWIFLFGKVDKWKQQ